MAKQTVNIGTSVNDGSGDPARTAFNKLNLNSNELYAALGADASGELPSALPIGKGGTGATTIAAARANLGLNRFAQNPGLNTVVGAPTADAAIIISDTGWGIYKGNATGFYRALNIADGGTGAETAVQARVNLELDRFYQQGEYNTFVMSPNKDLYINLENNSVSLYKVSANTSYAIRTGLNTIVDGNGFIKAASPIVKLFSEKIELNDEAQQQEIEFEKLGVGDYLIKGSSGFAQNGWYVETPKDANGNVLFSVIYETLENGDISVKTYKKKFDLETASIVADLAHPMDITANRWIDLRLQELPQPEVEVTDDPEQ